MRVTPGIDDLRHVKYSLFPLNTFSLFRHRGDCGEVKAKQTRCSGSFDQGENKP